MSSTGDNPESVILPTRNPRALGENPDTVQSRRGIFDELELGSGVPVIDESSPQTLSNKTLDANTTTIANTVDPTKGVKLDTTGATGTTSTMVFNQTVNRTYTVPDSGANASFVMTEGTQQVNGVKTFNAPLNLAGREYSEGAVQGQTVGAATAQLWAVLTANNSAYMVEVSVVAASAAGNLYACRASVAAKNVGGILTVSQFFNKDEVTELATEAVSTTIQAAGTTIEVRATGAAGLTLNWAGSAKVTYMAF